MQKYSPMFAYVRMASLNARKMFQQRPCSRCQASQTQSNHFYRRSRMNLIVFSARSGVVVPLPFWRVGLNKNWRRAARLGAGTRRPQAEPFQITRWPVHGIAVGTPAHDHVGDEFAKPLPAQPESAVTDARMMIKKFRQKSAGAKFAQNRLLQQRLVAMTDFGHFQPAFGQGCGGELSALNCIRNAFRHH